MYIIIFVIIIFILNILIYYTYIRSNKLRKIYMGETENEILKTLGSPDRIYDYIKVGDESYKYKGFDKFKFNRSGKIIIYSDKAEVLYILRALKNLT